MEFADMVGLNPIEHLFVPVQIRVGPLKISGKNTYQEIIIMRKKILVRTHNSLCFVQYMKQVHKPLYRLLLRLNNGVDDQMANKLHIPTVGLFLQRATQEAIKGIK